MALRQSSSYVGSVDILKFLLIVVIVVLHAGRIYGGGSAHMHMGGIAVEAFFIISGCLMCTSAARDAKKARAALADGAHDAQAVSAAAGSTTPSALAGGAAGAGSDTDTGAGSDANTGAGSGASTVAGTGAGATAGATAGTAQQPNATAGGVQTAGAPVGGLPTSNAPTSKTQNSSVFTGKEQKLATTTSAPAAATTTAAAIFRANSIGEDTARFMWRKIKGIAIPYCVIVVIYLVCWAVAKAPAEFAAGGAVGVVLTLLSYVPNLLLASMAGLAQEHVMIKVTWYVSAMLIVMLITYPLIRRFGKTYTMAVAPFVALVLMGYMYNSADLYKAVNPFVGFMVQGLMRAFIAINLGCTAYEIANKLAGLKLTALARGLCAVGAAAVLVVMFIVMEYGHDADCIGLVLLMPGLIGMMFSRQLPGEARLNNAVSKYLGKASTYMYLYHLAVRRITEDLFLFTPTYEQALVILLVGSFLLFVVTDLVERFVRAQAAKRNFKLASLFVRG